jgi:nucleoside-diphosphate-sugar epimerase
MIMSTVGKTILVLGATGGVGGAAARAFARRGWTIRALVRDVASAAKRWEGSEAQPLWIKGDAMSADDVLAAAEGVAAIVHAVNPPGYRDWEKLVLPMTDNTIAAARAIGARIIVPGNVYNYGPDAFDDPTEDSPQNPVTRKGAIRVEMEKRLERASGEGVRVLIVRCGYFFGPGASNNWFSQGLVKPGTRVTSISYPGKAGVGHQWAYLPDVGETMARLMEREADLERYASFNFEGHWDPDGERMTTAIRNVVGGEVSVKPMAWFLMMLASPFVTTLREIREMRYLWKVPLRMRNGKLVKFLGLEPHTDWEAAVGATLRAQGSL